ncbi:hypothetical protein [Exiguobacterium sp. s189]|uniref:hypothetical protein n=1 Tax=Exiguobacterium sp. s189 TaxID=2751263 RepID=UPI001BEC4B5F|nr:hypothetical protein [Exiguobacterium sp. s189]
MHKIETKNRISTFKDNPNWKENRERALENLRSVGFEVREGKKVPDNGVYSGVVGSLGEELVINLKK